MYIQLGTLCVQLGRKSEHHQNGDTIPRFINFMIANSRKRSALKKVKIERIQPYEIPKFKIFILMHVRVTIIMYFANRSSRIITNTLFVTFYKSFITTSSIPSLKSQRFYFRQWFLCDFWEQQQHCACLLLILNFDQFIPWARICHLLRLRTEKQQEIGDF